MKIDAIPDDNLRYKCNQNVVQYETQKTNKNYVENGLHFCSANKIKRNRFSEKVVKDLL